MDDFTSELGIGLIHLLWQVSGCPDAEDDSDSTRRVLISEVVDRLRGESLDHDSELRQLAVGFSDRMSGRSYEDRAKQFADDFVSFVIGEDPVGAFPARLEEQRHTIPKRELPPQELAEQQRRVKVAKDKCLTGLESVRDELDEKGSSNQ